MASFDFILHRGPVSMRTRDREAYARWKAEVRAAAERSLGGESFDHGARLQVVHLCRSATVDVDNVIKPIQDALIGLTYADDCVVTDVAGHRRVLGGPIYYSGLPSLLRKAWRDNRECVYVRVDDLQPPEDWR